MNLYYFDKNFDFPKSPVVTIGMFDGVHRGHQLIIKELVANAKKNNVEPLVITFSNHPRIVLKNDENKLRLLTTLEERYQLLEEHGINSCVEITFNKEVASYSATEFVKKYLIEQLSISKLVLGYDNYFGNKAVNDFDKIYALAENNKFSIEKVNALYCDGIAISSTQIRNALLANDVELANKMLGYHYFFSGKVVGGNKIGRVIGFPTANIAEIDPMKILPQNGAYIVYAELDKKKYRGMLNIGYRPTFEGKTQSIEVHLLNFEGDIYGKQIKIEILKKLREEQRFASVEELKKQLEEDKNQTVSYLN